MYIQLVYISEMRKQNVEEGRESCGDQRVGQYTYHRGLFCPSQQLLSPKGNPPNGPTKNQKSQQKNHFSLISKFLPPRCKQQLRAEPEFCSLCPRGSPGWAELPEPLELPSPLCYSGRGETCVTDLHRSGAHLPSPRGRAK